MDDLARWLGECLDEDERIARAATPGPWSRMGQRVLDPSPPSDRLGVGMAVGHAAASADFNETAAHIAAWDPARVLREIDAKRRILAEAAEYEPGIGGYAEMRAVLRLLALPYSDRPGFREEWAL